MKRSLAVGAAVGLVLLALLAFSGCDDVSTSQLPATGQAVAPTGGSLATATSLVATADHLLRQATLDAVRATLDREDWLATREAELATREASLATQQAALAGTQVESTAQAQATADAVVQQATAVAQATATAQAVQRAATIEVANRQASATADAARATATGQAVRRTATSEALNREATGTAAAAADQATATEVAYQRTATAAARAQRGTATAVAAASQATATADAENRVATQAAFYTGQTATAAVSERRRATVRYGLGALGVLLAMGLVVVLLVGLRALPGPLTAPWDRVRRGQEEGAEACPPVTVPPDAQVDVPSLRVPDRERRAVPGDQIVEVSSWVEPQPGEGQRARTESPVGPPLAPGLRTVHSLRRLDQAVKAGVMSSSLADALEADWRRGVGL